MAQVKPILPQQPGKTAQHQPRNHEQHYRARDFRGHQQAACVAALAGIRARACSAACGGTRSDRSAGRMPNAMAENVEDPAANSRTSQFTCTSSKRGTLAGTSASRAAHRQMPAPLQPGLPPPREPGSRSGAPSLIASVCPERGTHGGFAHGCGGARQLQIGEVHATNQEDSAHRRKQ